MCFCDGQRYNRGLMLHGYGDDQHNAFGALIRCCKWLLFGWQKSLLHYSVMSGPRRFAETVAFCNGTTQAAEAGSAANSYSTAG